MQVIALKTYFSSKVCLFFCLDHAGFSVKRRFFSNWFFALNTYVLNKFLRIFCPKEAGLFHLLDDSAAIPAFDSMPTDEIGLR